MEVPKISKIVVVDLVLQPFFADLIETVKLIEIDRVSIGHDHAMEYDGDPALLAEATCPDLARLTEHDRSIGNEHMLAIVRIDGARNQDLHRTRCITIEPIHQNRVHRQAFINHVRLANRRIDIDLGAPLGWLIAGRICSSFPPPTSRDMSRSPAGSEGWLMPPASPVQMRIRISTRCRLWSLDCV